MQKINKEATYEIEIKIFNIKDKSDKKHKEQNWMKTIKKKEDWKEDKLRKRTKKKRKNS